MSNCMHSSASVKSAPRIVFSFPHAAYGTKPAECKALEAISIAVQLNNKILALKPISVFSLALPPSLSLFHSFTLYRKIFDRNCHLNLEDIE